VNGKHYDLEMHIVHVAETVNSTTPIAYAAVGFFFDVDDFDPTITTA
jgi:carbonic anhydrase